MKAFVGLFEGIVFYNGITKKKTFISRSVYISAADDTKIKFKYPSPAPKNFRELIE